MSHYAGPSASAKVHLLQSPLNRPAAGLQTQSSLNFFALFGDQSEPEMHGSEQSQRGGIVNNTSHSFEVRPVGHVLRPGNS